MSRKHISRAYIGLRAGFTAVELLAVLILMAVLAVAGIPRLTSLRQSAEWLDAERLAAFLRQSQKTAVVARRLVCIEFTPGGIRAVMAEAASDKGCAVAVPALPALELVAQGASFYFVPSGAAVNAAGDPFTQTVMVGAIGAVNIEGASGLVALRK